MDTLPPLPSRAPIWRRRVLALAALISLAGCSSQGDFGEVRPSLVRNDMHNWLSLDAIAGKPTWPSDFELTDDERALRDVSYPLIEPPYDRQQWYSAAGEYGIIGSSHRAVFDRTTYFTRMITSRVRSSSSRYAHMTDDISNDIIRLPQFYETAGRVLDIDRKREKSMSFIADLSAAERTNARRRIRENAGLVALVNAKLTQRVASYRFALGRLVVMTPSPEAVDVERALNRLEAQIAYYRTHPAPAWVREQSLASVR